MRLHTLRLQNFRAYRDEVTLTLPPLTAFVGRNDVGKSTIFEALGAFFEHEQCKIEAADRCVHAAPAETVSITCVFDDLPSELVLDESAKTSLKDEYLLNEDGLLEIKKVYSGDRMKEETFAIAHHPSAAPAADLLLKKNADLKKIAGGVKATADQRSNVELRRAIREKVPDLRLQRTEVPLAKEGAKEIWGALRQHLPMFALFRADRPSTDQDGEVQDPMQFAVRQALREVEPELRSIQDRVEKRAMDVANRTLEKLTEFDERLSSTLSPRFRSDPKWDGIFKLSLSGDHDIPINKRGSGVRRLVLLSFFQAEVARRRTAESVASVIYAIEEPETSQHPGNQVAVVEALKELASGPGCQVLLTTHVPALASLLPVQSIRHVVQNEELKRTVDLGEGILKAIADDLGVLPDMQDHRVKVFLCVEGPTDVEFFRNITGAVRSVNADLPELGVDPRVAIVPLGGDTLKAWVNKHYLRELGLPEVHIYDSDVEAYADSCAEVNARGDGSWACQTTKREIENYLHADAINEALGVRVTVSDTNDVEADVTAALGKSRVNRRTIKRCLSEDAALLMTAQRLRSRGALDEIVGWYERIGSYLQGRTS